MRTRGSTSGASRNGAYSPLCAPRVPAATLCVCCLHQSGTCAAQCSPVRAAMPPLHVRYGTTEAAKRLAEAIFSDMLRSSPLAPYVEASLLHACVLFDHGQPH